MRSACMCHVALLIIRDKGLWQSVGRHKSKKETCLLLRKPPVHVFGNCHCVLAVMPSSVRAPVITCPLRPLRCVRMQECNPQAQGADRDAQ